MEITIAKPGRIRILEDACAWTVALAMFIYGAAKVVQFRGATAIEKPLAELTGMELMWAFYGYSNEFLIVLGVLEVTGGLLLLFRRTRLLGALFVSSILVNIILQDIFYGVNTGALIAALLYQAFLFVIFILRRDTLLAAVKKLMEMAPNPGPFRQKALAFLLTFVLLAILRVFEYFITHL
jgi:hypothetical protein